MFFIDRRRAEFSHSQCPSLVSCNAVEQSGPQHGEQSQHLNSEEQFHFYPGEIDLKPGKVFFTVVN